VTIKGDTYIIFMATLCQIYPNFNISLLMQLEINFEESYHQKRVSFASNVYGTVGLLGLQDAIQPYRLVDRSAKS